VDPVARRLYLLKFRQLPEDASDRRTVAEQVLVFSAEDLASIDTLPLPARGAEGAIYNPKGISVDPSSHDLLIGGYQSEQSANFVIDRISSAGAPVAQFVDPDLTDSVFRTSRGDGGGVFTDPTLFEGPYFSSDGAVYLANNEPTML